MSLHENPPDIENQHRNPSKGKNQSNFGCNFSNQQSENPSDDYGGYESDGTFSLKVLERVDEDVEDEGEKQESDSRKNY
jgi:hypothetical protein